MLPLKSLHDAVCLTFEEMAFLDVAEGAGPHPLPVGEEGPILYLEYHRPQIGALALFLPKDLKFQIVEAIYGEDWALLSTIQLDDSLLELLNVLAGRLLSERFGVDTPYSMGLPTVLYDPPGELPGYTCQTFTFHVDSSEFTLSWYEVTP